MPSWKPFANNIESGIFITDVNAETNNCTFILPIPLRKEEKGEFIVLTITNRAIPKDNSYGILIDTPIHIS